MGYGRVGQHRKSGGRGGKGKAGGRKHFWIRTVKYEPDRYRSIGFKPPSALRPSPETINVGELEDLALRALGADQLRNRDGPLEIDLAKMGYGKLLGQGEVGMPLRLRVTAYTPAALEKVEAAGGAIVEPE
ncbi:hypothetical protein AC482_02565 [miscellaneous Crenarchaeota group-15 archaeon DG-45]|uniref:50S ribosomal protein L15 n=1 Tax=miscellaneous Crenarchaeota group-15 archaeon DG-45 TaxID=1685127 RepID=A0A0M0BQN4_9ARCH|nr:MAG: hypothetical protein AC482_02565 [miscellaneous Crenarchaeota group-15 archaeon DG-45]